MKTPSNKSFGIVFSIFFLLLAVYFLDNHITFYFFGISLLLVLFTIFYSKIFTLPNYFWTKLGFFLSKVISPLVIVMIYFVGVLLTRIFLILFNKDILNLKIDRNNKTYWINSNENTKQTMDQQF